ncbi:MAG: M23 family metallopeptidase [Alphaproteobacteria bacterium]
MSVGDTLDGLLASADIAPALRLEFTLAMATEFDLSRLRPGDRVIVQSHEDGTPLAVTLIDGEGVRVMVTLEDGPEVRRLAPATTTVERAHSVTVDGSIFAALERADAPTRFAVDLALILAGVVDFRRDLAGGEDLTLLWTEEITEAGERIGQPALRYAVLAFDGTSLEVIWPNEVGDATTIYRDGEPIRTFAPPVVGARLTSVFGKRRHPIYGDVRMHTGVDFATQEGAPIYATASGRVAFLGRRNGYGRVIEIAHDPSLITRYSHLSAFSDDLAEGDRVEANQRIGAVGSSGLATAPNLHYEVLLNNKPVNPLNEARLSGLEPEDARLDLKGVLQKARTRVTGLLDQDRMPVGNVVLSTKGDPT